MILTDLAVACRKSGLKVVEGDNWKSHGHGPFASVDSIICHHTAGPATGGMPSLNVITHGRAGLSGPLCNLGLGRDGTVYVIAAGIGYHAGVVRSTAYANNHSIGIEAEATGVSGWPPVQMDAYAALCAALSTHYEVPVDRVLGHKEVCSPMGRKIDPNFDMAVFRQAVKRAKETDMTPDQIATAPLTMLKGKDNVPTKTTLQDALRDLEGTQDKHGLLITEILAVVKGIAEKG